MNQVGETSDAKPTKRINIPSSLQQEMEAMYVGGATLRQVSSCHGISVSTLRRRLLERGVLRGQAQARDLAKSLGRYTGRPGKREPMPEETRKKLSESRTRWGEKNARGVSTKATGYVQFTRGEHKHRSEHVVAMERRLGRRLLPDECVHHIDRNPSNNSIHNLALMTRSAHARLHRFEDALQGKTRERINGRFA